jgi:hypothetical protein
MDGMVELIQQLPAEWQSIATFVVAVWLFFTKRNKRKYEEGHDTQKDVIKLLIDSINQQKELVRVKDALETIEDDETKIIRKRRLHEIDFGDLDVDDITVSRIVHEKVTNGGSEVSKEDLDELIEEVETGAKNREIGGGLVRGAVRTARIVLGKLA